MSTVARKKSHATDSRPFLPALHRKLTAECLPNDDDVSKRPTDSKISPSSDVEGHAARLVDGFNTFDAAQNAAGSLPSYDTSRGHVKTTPPSKPGNSRAIPSALHLPNTKGHSKVVVCVICATRLLGVVDTSISKEGAAARRDDRGAYDERKAPFGPQENHQTRDASQSQQRQHAESCMSVHISCPCRIL